MRAASPPVVFLLVSWKTAPCVRASPVKTSRSGEISKARKRLKSGWPIGLHCVVSSKMVAAMLESLMRKLVSVTSTPSVMLVKIACTFSRSACISSNKRALARLIVIWSAMAVRNSRSFSSNELAESTLST